MKRRNLTYFVILKVFKVLMGCFFASWWSYFTFDFLVWDFGAIHALVGYLFGRLWSFFILSFDENSRQIWFHIQNISSFFNLLFSRSMSFSSVIYTNGGPLFHIYLDISPLFSFLTKFAHLDFLAKFAQTTRFCDMTKNVFWVEEFG